MSVVLVVATCPNIQTAENIMRDLLENRLAACIQIGQPVSSFYRWQGKIQTSSEFPISVKTTENKASAVISKIRELHPFEIPEILSIPIQDGFKAYLEWVKTETN